MDGQDDSTATTSKKRRVAEYDTSDSLGDEQPLKRQCRRILSNEIGNDNSSATDTDTTTNSEKPRGNTSEYRLPTHSTHSFMEMEKSYSQHGLWSIKKMRVSPDQTRIGFILSRNNRYKILLVSTMSSTNRKEHILWRKEGDIDLTSSICWHRELNKCVIGRSPNLIEIFRFSFAGSSNEVQVTSQIINMHCGRYRYDPNIKYLDISDTQISLVTERGILCTRSLCRKGPETANNATLSAVQLLSWRQGINALNGVRSIKLIGSGGSSRFVILLKSPKHLNRMILYDGTRSLEVRNPNHWEWHWDKEFVRVISDRNMKRIVLQNGQKLYVLELEKKESNDNTVSVQQHLNGAQSFNLGMTVTNQSNQRDGDELHHFYQSEVMFEERFGAGLSIEGFLDEDCEDTFIGFTANEVMLWRMCCTGTMQCTKLLKGTVPKWIPENICSVLAEFVTQIPQKVTIRFKRRIQTDERALRGSSCQIAAVDTKTGNILLHDADENSVLFHMDYNAIIKHASNMGCLHYFTMTLPGK